MSTEEQENNIDPTVLRAQLKKWETDFRAANNGRKPSRGDIKNDASIAAKYKQYEGLTKRILNPSTATPKKRARLVGSTDVLGERPKNAISSTPRKTPSKANIQLDVPSPVQELEPTPAHVRKALGRTPQRDGQVLGIFDIFSGETPTDRVEKVATQDTDKIVAATPSKVNHVTSDAHFSKTPQSAGKRYFLDSFAGTPLKRKRERDDDVGTTSSSKRKFATPSFLRRSRPLAPVYEDSTETSSAPAPFRRRGLVRSLSSIIQGLRKQENDAADEEWEIMKELDEEAEQGPTPSQPPEILVEDSQAMEMPLGPDQAPHSGDEASGDERGGVSRKPWKKKGLKRQTRRVIMRPVLHKAKKADDEELSDDGEAVPESQIPKTREGNDDCEDSDAEFPADGTTHKSKASESARSKAKDKKPATKEHKKPLKVNPDAHANFRKLKIKNKNSKGNGRKFGRRR